MTPAGALLAAEIAAHGPLPFSRFMEVALYHPEHGYYRGDPFGRGGDFYTAEQLQPTFGLLLARVAQQAGVTQILQPGAGRAALAETFAGFNYQPLDIGYGEWPERFEGLILAHELFDALPVDAAIRDGARWRHRRVGVSGDRFRWITAEPLDPGFDVPAEVEIIEIPRGLTTMTARIGAVLQKGHVLVLDYGYTDRERLRFPQGTLMSYRSHRAIDDVLGDPGLQDITAHVPFTALEHAAARHGLRMARFESMGSLLLRAGEQDQFGGILGDDPQRRLQLKSLLFDLGESFRAMWLEKL